LSYLVTKEKKKKSLELDDNRGLEVLSFIKWNLGWACGKESI
jgi:hypothetical protein